MSSNRGFGLEPVPHSHLQAHMHPASDTFDSVKVESIINILRGNLQQWGFIEGQLMEPDVNLKMPEILIPLRHFTTTLEVLGNIFFVKGEVCEARCFLERACPLLAPPLWKMAYNPYKDCYGVLKQIYTSIYSTAAGALSGTEETGWKHHAVDCDTSTNTDCALGIGEQNSGAFTVLYVHQ